ncbi:hypothetical protein [Serratia plymuthica]|uniref:hypothetical protein n=1 Tax=Serratia plymuthica TaxID=82996 RepID=UPI000AA7183E|nr:hypothetical protein [Serratia plymuthica]
MSIKTLTEDAIFLRDNGRYLSSLSLMCIAIAASARLMYPKRTKSFVSNDCMRDEEAFTTCFKVALSKSWVENKHEDHNVVDICKFDYKNAEYSLGDIIYKFYRCNLIHEASLPKEIDFVESIDGRKGKLSISGCGVGIDVNGIYLSYNWIDLLYFAVSNLLCNAKEFGVEHFDFVMKNGIDEAVYQDGLFKKYDITYGRLLFFKEFLMLSDNYLRDFSGMTAGQLQIEFEEAVRLGDLHDSYSVAFRSQGLIDVDGKFTEKALNLFNEICDKYEKIKLA